MFLSFNLPANAENMRRFAEQRVVEELRRLLDLEEEKGAGAA